MINSAFDVVIVGGGAAGMTAGLYSSRAGFGTVVLERMMPGGQVVNADRIENLPGFPDGISGAELGPLLQEQATKFGLKVELAEVTSLELNDSYWTVVTHESEFAAKTVIIASGSTLRKLGVSNEESLHGAGVSYCATCDGVFFTNQVVGVVGGGDSALDEAMTLAELASKVIIFHRRDQFSAQKVLRERVLSSPRIEVRWNTAIDAILGEREVEGVGVTDVVTGETSRVDLSSLFIYVGLEPNTSYLNNIVSLDDAGHISTDIWMRTPRPGLLAAGDARQNSAAQLASAVGDGATAAIAAQRYIESGEWSS